MSPLKTVILSLPPRLRVPVSSSCVHRDREKPTIVLRHVFLKVELRLHFILRCPSFSAIIHLSTE